MIGEKFRRSRLAPAAIVFILSVFALLPSVLSVPQHGDEAIYAWGGRYYWNKVTHLDFAYTEPSTYADPGWDPSSVWSETGPVLTRLVYGAILAVTGAPVPVVPYEWSEPAHQGPENLLSRGTLLIVRLTAVVCAGLGFALFAVRLGWLALAATVLMLVIPEVRDDLGRAWAEGPLFLGLGLCALAYGTRWLGAAGGLALTFKLTALVAWPLMFLRGANGQRRYSLLTSFVSAIAVFTVLTPPSWYRLGPAYLALMVVDRFRWLNVALFWPATIPGYVPPSPEVGLFNEISVPTRYLLPFEWLLCIGLAWLFIFALHHFRRSAGHGSLESAR